MPPTRTPPTDPPGPFGGQALIEGVMIRGPHSMTIAVRCPDGRIITEAEAVTTPYADAVRRIPFVRGVATLYDTFSLGIRALYRSARISTGQEHEPITRAEIAISAATITAAAAVFFTGPVLLTSWLGRHGSDWYEVLAEGALRLAMLVGYIWFVGRLPEVKRVFAYHGAEHRTIHAWEHGLELTRDNIRDFPNAHPRCGTAFLLTVAALSFVTFTLLGTPPIAERILERILLTPVIAAVAYEFIRASQRFEAHPLMRVLQQPNLWLQKLTTRDPDDEQIDVAIAAMRAAEHAELLAADQLEATASAAAAARHGAFAEAEAAVEPSKTEM